MTSFFCFPSLFCYSPRCPSVYTKAVKKLILKRKIMTRHVSTTQLRLFFMKDGNVVLGVLHLLRIFWLSQDVRGGNTDTPFSRHTNEPPASIPSNKKEDPFNPVATRVENDVEVYDTGPSIPFISKKDAVPPDSSPSIKGKTTTNKGAVKPLVVDQTLEEDDLSIQVVPGTKCKRSGCGKEYTDEAQSRAEGGIESMCVYHSGSPVFHEGSKGNSDPTSYQQSGCCSRKVLEFDEFLKIGGCKTGKHLFVGSGKNSKLTEETVSCRHDWLVLRLKHIKHWFPQRYQTPTWVIMSVFAKKVDKERSTVSFSDRELSIDLKMQEGKHFRETYPLYQHIDPKNSTFEVLSTKVEIKMKKANGISWPSLRLNEGVVTGVTTFGVTGGNATVGGKEYSLATDSPLYTQT
ncbi:hypothetical protein G9A89_014585 [Geosiphon pyriformis]|nr:hypothetical protein G9A89_014585 [Geosiphon pyriformis]